MTDAVLLIEHANGRFEATAELLPVRVGGDRDSDVVMSGVRGQIQIGLLDDVFFVQSGQAGTRVRVNGEPVAGSRRLRDGDEIGFDTARLGVSLHDGRLVIGAREQRTAGDTAPPDLADLVRAGAPGRNDDVEITPISFRVDASTRVAPRQHRPTVAQALIGSAFVLLAVLAWFAFTAKSVEFVFDDEVNDVKLPATLFQFQIGDRHMLRAGRHRVVAERAGYYRLDTQVRVGADSSQTLELAFVKLPGLVTITTEPASGVAVLLDGEPIGEAPLENYEIRPGPHELAFVLARYFPERVTLEVEGGYEQQAVRANLTQNWAPVRITSVPTGADVVVGGRVVGQTPAAVELDQGSHDIELRRSGFNAWRTELDVTANEPFELPTVTLEAADGRLRLVSEPSGAAISLNGDYVGTTPLDLRLRPGRTHTVVASKPGFETVSRELTVAADSGRTVPLELAPLFGQVSIASSPTSAAVWVDGEQRATTPATLELSALPHEIEVRLAGHATVARSLTPRVGFPQKLDVVLEVLDDLSGGGYPRVVTTSLGQELRIVPAGEFTLGTSRRDQDRSSNEVLRPVKLTRAFYLGSTEVTNAQFRAFRPEHDSGSFGELSLNGDDQPVVKVTWEDIAAYCNWLSVRDGLQPTYEQRDDGWFIVRPPRNGYRLPTEAEWAWAARFATLDAPLVYPWSASAADVAPSDRSGNYADVSAASILPRSLYTYNDDFPVSAPVGSFAANPLGLHDLGGNVAEWVLDYYALDLLTSNSVAEDPLGPTAGTYYVLRGSSWRSATVKDLRIAARSYGNDSRDDLGFRIARNLQ